MVTWAHLESSFAVPHSVLKFFNLNLQLRTLYQRLDVRRVAVECRRAVVDRTTVVTELELDRAAEGGTRVSVQSSIAPRWSRHRAGIGQKRVQAAAGRDTSECASNTAGFEQQARSEYAD
jgi:hypothetical protein